MQQAAPPGLPLPTGDLMTTSTQQESSLLSIADIARHFDLPESTARYYCKRFAEHIPSVGEGRRRRYRPETLEVIALVLEEMQKSRTAASVEELLATQFPRNVEIRSLSMSLPPAHEKKDIQVVSASPVASMTPQETFPLPESPVVLQLLERQTTALEGMLQILRLLVERMPLPEGGSTEQTEKTPELWKEVQTLRTLLEACEKNHQSDLEQIRKWVGKLIQRQPSA